MKKGNKSYKISLAIDSETDFLITGDKDLLELVKVGGTTILKYSDFDKIQNSKP